MLILGLENPQGETHYVAAAFPSACGKTNLAMLIPPEGYRAQGWKVWTVGDDICWMRPGADGRLYAINPEAGFFGVAPGTSAKSNPNALKSIAAQHHLHQRRRHRRQPAVVGRHRQRHTPVIDWRGEAYDAAKRSGRASELALHRVGQAVPELFDARPKIPQACRSRAIVFGGRRASLVPLVFEARDWTHGVLVGAAMGSETTAAATGAVGVMRRDPMAMKPFCGYNFADYFSHWLSFDSDGAKLPKIFHVNWFRKGDDGKFLWPGFGDNLRVLEWMIGRVKGEADAVETPIGHLPTAADLNLDGIALSDEAKAKLFGFDHAGWKAEFDSIGEYLDEYGPRMPQALKNEQRRISSLLQD